MSTPGYSCYILHNPENDTTYNGSTNNTVRRLRQHNGEISGGARATKRLAGRWVYLAMVTADPPLEHNEALSLEWHIRYPNGRRPRPRSFAGPTGRLRGLCLALDNPKFAGHAFRVLLDPSYSSFLDSNPSSLAPNSAWELMPQGPT